MWTQVSDSISRLFYPALPPEPKLEEVAPNSFIFEMRNALSREDCAEILEIFESNKEEQQRGVVGWGLYKPNVKQSTDIMLRGQDHWERTDSLLHHSLLFGCDLLKEQCPLFAEESLEDVGYQIQRTDPGGFYKWHNDAPRHSRKRRLVAIWYLNDVPRAAGGATEFKSQGVKIQPEAGKLLLFPSFWTHTHRGGKLLAGQKYIATTWICFMGANDHFDDNSHPDEKGIAV